MCECGNPLAGDMTIAEMGDEDGAVEYAKGVIEGYNEGGDFFQPEFLEYAKRVVLQREAFERSRLNAY